MKFEDSFDHLTGHQPFPWQRALYEDWFSKGNIPATCNLPTGLGKTSVIAVWLLALASGANVPRRLVYVVNRRTVVDQTTNEAVRLRDNAHKIGIPDLAISTLRGQFADNREWSADPSRPAVICGTVDMIGSRLLFSGYGVGFKSKPLHAGFLGQDVLLVHDEAHLEPAFQKLIESIRQEQDRCNEFAKFRVMELTATTRSNSEQAAAPAFTLEQEDRNHPVVKQRIEAAKHLHLTSVEDDKQIPGKIAEIAANYKDANAAVLVFSRTLEAVSVIEKELAKTKRPVVLLTGTMRGKERDELVEKPEFKRFLKGAEPGETVYLVCTSAGEVGIDISADHMVCDLSTFDSMAQRLGRVNRYGDRTDTRIDVVHPTSFGKTDKNTGELKADEIDKRRQKTLELLKQLPVIGENQHDASPLALGELDPQARLDAFAPEPTILPATDILFDAWSMTSIRGRMPGRPPVEPYLHGIRDWEPPETHVAWREEVGVITGDLLSEYPREDLLDEYPLKPHELLQDRSDRVFKHLEALAERHGEKPVWLVDDRESIEVVTLKELADKRRKDRINGCTILLPPSVGGLTASGLLDGSHPPLQKGNDVADGLTNENEKPIRIRLWKNDDDPDFDRAAGMRLILRIDFPPPEDDEDAERRSWYWFERPIPKENSKNAAKPVLLDVHVSDVVNRARDIIANLELDDRIRNAIIVAAQFHDLGKKRELWQRSIGRPLKYGEEPVTWFAKSGRRWKSRDISKYRHEFGSLIDLQSLPEFQSLDDDSKDLVQHLIAAHHGQGRPHFTAEQTSDPDSTTSTPPTCEAITVETPRRFARLQRKFGRWGLAYLESLLRAADWSASAAPSAFFTEEAK